MLINHTILLSWKKRGGGAVADKEPAFIEITVAGQDGILAGRFHAGDDYRVYRPEGRKDWLMIFTLSGRGEAWTPAGEAVCEAGTLVLLKAGVPHRYGTAPGAQWRFYWAHFPGEDIDPALLPERSAAAVRPVEDRSARSRIVGAFRRILADAREQPPFWYDLCIGALEEILALSMRRSGSELDPRVAEALRLMARRSREPLRVEELAAAVGLSPSRLSHLFKSETGRSIIDTLNAIRVREAALMLEFTRLGASEIAYSVGFQNYNHFLNQFRRRYGMSPGAYRRRAENPG